MNVVLIAPIFRKNFMPISCKTGLLIVYLHCTRTLYDNTTMGTRRYNNSFNLRANTITTPAINCAGKDAITF